MRDSTCWSVTDDSLWYFTNSDAAEPQCLPPGIYGLSNARLDTPWPKVVLGKARLLALLQEGPISHDVLATVITDRRLADQRTLSGHGLDGSMETTLSAQFIVTDRLRHALQHHRCGSTPTTGPAGGNKALMSRAH